MQKRRKVTEKDISLSGNAVKVISKETLGLSLRLFKKKLKESGKLQEFMDRQEFVKPSARRRRQKQEAILKQKRLDKLYT